MGQAVYWLFGLRPHSALHRINFDLAHGECLGIWGNNGIGKATLLNTLQGHLQAWSGQIMLNGKDITRLPAHLRARAGLGLVPQGRQIFPNLTVRENLEMGRAKLCRADLRAKRQPITASMR